MTDKILKPEEFAAPVISSCDATISFGAGMPGMALDPPSGTMDPSTVMMGYQVNSNSPLQIPSSFINFAAGTFTVPLNTGVCPTVGATYSLVVYAWSPSGSMPSTNTPSFTRGS